MKIPKQFYIKGKLWKVRRRKKIKLNGEDCSGLTDLDTLTITIHSELQGDRLEWVFWHEYFHAVLAETSVPGNTGGMSDLAEEIVCDAFATCMTSDKVVKFKRTRKAK
jgi:hypothetical protein